MAISSRLVGLVVAFLPLWSFAGSARITLDVAPDLVAEAEYWPGQAALPSVLILHGFLQTREYPTVYRLAESLAGEGLSVLVPSLTLGISQRQRSLPCEAIHTHAMADDIAELYAWTKWLTEHSGKPPILIGHSAGGAQLAALLDRHPELAVERIVLISLSDFDGEISDRDLSAELSRLSSPDSSRSELQSFAISFCKRYISTPANALSYLTWDKARLQASLLRAPTPVTLIYGDADERIDAHWLQTLQRAGVQIRPIVGANHFFDLANEFDLLDEVLRAITGPHNG